MPEWIRFLLFHADMCKLHCRNKEKLRNAHKQSTLLVLSHRTISVQISYFCGFRVISNPLEEQWAANHPILSGSHMRVITRRIKDQAS